MRMIVGLTFAAIAMRLTLSVAVDFDTMTLRPVGTAELGILISGVVIAMLGFIAITGSGPKSKPRPSRHA